MTQFFRDSDASLEPLAGRTIAILGYGNQGRAQALNLRDSGQQVIVGNADDDYAEQARQDGFTTFTIAEAALRGDVLMCLIPDELTPAINLGLVEFAANASLLVSPTTNRAAVKAAIDGLKPAPKTATGEGIFTALQAIATVGSVMGGGDGPPPARIVLESDGAENVPLDPNAPQGAFTAARAAKAEEVQISTISFGTPYGTVDYEGTTIPVPVDDQTLQEITKITDGQAFHADSLQSLEQVYSTLQRQIGYETVKGRQPRLDAARGPRPRRGHPGRPGAQQQAAVVAVRPGAGG